MPPSDQTSLSVYDRCDPAHLRNLLETAGMDIFILARNACLSVGQVRELESGQNGHYFYSDTKKRKAYKRVTTLLGSVPLLASKAQHTNEPPIDLYGRLASLDSIVAMRNRPSIERSGLAALRLFMKKLNTHRSIIGLFGVIALSFGGIAQYLFDHLDARISIAVSIASTPASPPALPAVAVAVAAPARSAEFKCAYTNDAIHQWAPVKTRKEARYVYLVSGASTDVCVVDAQKRITHLQMKAGESQSVFGTAPWQISGAHLQKIKIYFQGGLVMLPQGAQALTLLEAPLAP